MLGPRGRVVLGHGSTSLVMSIAVLAPEHSAPLIYRYQEQNQYVAATNTPDPVLLH